MNDCIDEAVLTAMADSLGDAVVTAILAAFVRNAPERDAALGAGIEAGGATLRDAAHTLTAASATVGAVPLSELCWVVESGAGTADEAAAQTAATLARDELDRAVAALRETRWAQGLTV